MTSPWEPTPLREQAERRKILAFLKAALSLIRSMISLGDSASKARVGAKVFMLMKTRVIRELQWLRYDLSRELCGIMVLILLELLGIEETVSQAQELLEQWLGDQQGWKGIVEDEIHRMVSPLYQNLGFPS